MKNLNHLIKQIQLGDESAFKELTLLIENDLYRIAKTRLYSDDDIMDAIQNTMLITFKNSKNAPAIIDIVPLDKMLIETDSPYLSPEPHRGQRNDCRNVKYVAQKIADLKGISLEEIAKQTYENAMKIFEIEK